MMMMSLYGSIERAGLGHPKNESISGRLSAIVNLWSVGFYGFGSDTKAPANAFDGATSLTALS